MFGDLVHRRLGREKRPATANIGHLSQLHVRLAQQLVDHSREPLEPLCDESVTVRLDVVAEVCADGRQRLGVQAAPPVDELEGAVHAVIAVLCFQPGHLSIVAPSVLEK